MKRNKHEKGMEVNRKELIGAVDIGMSVNYGYFRTWDGEEEAPFAFDNNRQGFERFYTKLCAFRDAHGLETAVIGFESTGVYGVPLIYFLRTKQVRLVQVNPMHTNRVKELNGNSPNKTDRKDPRVIADIMMLGHALSVVVPSGAAAELRCLVHARERARARRTVVCNQLHALVYVIFPELLMILKHVDSASVISVTISIP